MPGPCSSPICAPAITKPSQGTRCTPAWHCWCQDAALPKLCHLGGEAGCKADCSIQLALISPSASGCPSCSALKELRRAGPTEQPPGHSQGSAPTHPRRCTQGHTGIRGAMKPSVAQHPSLNAPMAQKGCAPKTRGQRGPVPVLLGSLFMQLLTLAIVETAAGCRKERGTEQAQSACPLPTQSPVCAAREAAATSPREPGWLPPCPAQGTVWEGLSPCFAPCLPPTSAHYAVRHR